MNPWLSVVIPAYNEEKRLTKTLEAIYVYLAKQQYEWEIIVVLDGPKDNTLGCVQKFSVDRENIRWIDRKENKGKGYTVREGMLAARGDIRLFTDADNSTDINHFDRMRPLFGAGYEVVICSRDSRDAVGAEQAVPQPYLKRLLGKMGNLFVRTIAVPGIRDTQCGFKAFTSSAAGSIFSASQIDGWGFDIEALALARCFGYDIGIVPAHWIDDAETNVRSWNYVEVLFETMKVRRNLISGVYKRGQRIAKAAGANAVPPQLGANPHAASPPTTGVEAGLPRAGVGHASE